MAPSLWEKGRIIERRRRGLDPEAQRFLNPSSKLLGRRPAASSRLGFRLASFAICRPDVSPRLFIITEHTGA